MSFQFVARGITKTARHDAYASSPPVFLACVSNQKYCKSKMRCGIGVLVCVWMCDAHRYMGFENLRTMQISKIDISLVALNSKFLGRSWVHQSYSEHWMRRYLRYISSSDRDLVSPIPHTVLPDLTSVAQVRFRLASSKLTFCIPFRRVAQYVFR